MTEEPKISISPAVLAAFSLAEPFRQGQVRERERYERLIITADACGISREDVDAKLAVSTYQETHDWITGAKPRSDPRRHDLADVVSRMLASGGSL